MTCMQDANSLQSRSNGWSLLHLAAGTGQAASVQMLLRQGADVHGVLLYDTCHIMHNSAVCISLLLNPGARIHGVLHLMSVILHLMPVVPSHTVHSMLY